MKVERKICVYVVIALVSCASLAAAVEPQPGATTLRWTRRSDDTARTLSVGEQEVGVVRGDADHLQLEVPADADRPAVTLVTLLRSEEQLGRDRYPRKVVVEGRLPRSDARVREEYVVLAPAAPLRIEGDGLHVSADWPRAINQAEEQELQAWLRGKGLPDNLQAFDRLHAADSGRQLRVWYEISGRRVNGLLTRGASRDAAARFDSLFHVEKETWRIHHARPLYYPQQPFYHRESLELVDTLNDVSGQGRSELRSYHCGCYGWAIATDWVTLGKKLYHVKVEYVDHSVGGGVFLGLQRRDSFPWFGIGDRTRMGLLARRVKAYQLTDAHDKPFGEIAIRYPADPVGDDLGPASYEIRLAKPNGEMRDLASIDYKSDDVTVVLHSEAPAAGAPARPSEPWMLALEQLDAVLAAMPTQVVRGDGIRDSFLGDVEQLVDRIRVIQSPTEETLADVVSDVDALTAVTKVERLLAAYGNRFDADPTDLPQPPKRLSRSPYDLEGSSIEPVP
jgi:hypothetical protein